jgi:hypothetical protein
VAVAVAVAGLVGAGAVAAAVVAVLEADGLLPEQPATSRTARSSVVAAAGAARRGMRRC